MVGQVTSGEAAPIQQNEKIISSAPPTIAKSPHIELHLKAKAEINEFVVSRIPTDYREEADRVFVTEKLLGKELDLVGDAEVARVTDFSEVRKPTQLDQFINNPQIATDSASLITTLQELPEDTDQKQDYIKDVMKVRVLRSYKKVRSLGSLETGIIPVEQNEDTALTELLAEGEAQKVNKYFTEMKTFGIDGVELYYGALENMSKPKDDAGRLRTYSDVDTIAHTTTQAIRNMELPREQKHILEERVMEFAKHRREKIRGYSTTKLSKAEVKDKVEQTKITESVFQKHLNEVWDAFQYFTKDSEKVFLLNRLPQPILKALVGMRDLSGKVSSEMVTSDLIARYGWQMRVDRAQEMVQIFSEKFGEVVKTPNFARFVDRVKDEFLKTEASGFEIRENIRIKDNVSTEAMLRESMNSLLKIHRPRGQDKVYFTVFYGEDKMQKICVNTKEDITTEELDDNIATALSNSRMTDVQNSKGEPLSFKERAELGYKRYSLKRDTDETYKHIYKHGENNEINGDYVIQIKGHNEAGIHSEDTVDAQSPETLFAVDDHQMALLLDKRSYLDGVPAMKTVLRYKHSKIDGVPAYAHSQKVFTALKDLKADRYTHLQEAGLANLDSYIETMAPQDDIGAPRLEGRAIYKEQGEAYPSLQIPFTDDKGESKAAKLSPAFTRAFIYALANDVDVFHYLHAASKENDIFFDERGDRFDSLQPIYTSFNHLKDELHKWKGEKEGTMNPEDVQEWLLRFNGLKSRAESKYCDVFTFAAAPPGKLETPFAKISGLVHGGAAMLTAPQGGMYSGLPPQPESEARASAEADDKSMFDTEFSTAEASLYNNIPINLLKVSPCMGVVGYLQRGDVAVSTCRKLPCQAQETFRDEFLKLAPELDEKQQKTFLKQFHPLLTKWDGLIKGTNTLSDFVETRKQLFEKISEEDIPGRDMLVQLGCTDTIAFQRYLDGILKKSAEDTLDKDKILQTKTEFMQFLQAANVDVLLKVKK